MRLGILGDAHFSGRRPESRTDEDYFQTQMGKLDQAFTFFDEWSCDCIIQVGDLFDRPSTDNEVKAQLISFLRHCSLPFYCIYGQHDISGHSADTFYRSPMRVLQEAESLEVVGQTGIPIASGVDLYGASFRQPIPEVEPKDGLFNILVIHAMIGSRPLWPGQELKNPKRFLQKHSFDLVLCGDYHYSFQEQVGDRWIVNPGCLVRKTVAKWDLAHEPMVGMFDTKKRTYKTRKLDVLPVEDVFRLETSKKAVGDSEALDKFIRSLKENKVKGTDWKGSLHDIIEKDGYGSRISHLFDGFLAELAEMEDK